MAGPIEILIVAGLFGLVGLYLYIVHRFIRESEKDANKDATSRVKQSPPLDDQPGPQGSRVPHSPAKVSH